MINLLKQVALFLLVFALINDNFVVNIAGGSALKIIFAFFVLLNAKDILQSLVQVKHSTMKLFYLFFFTLTIITFIDIFLGYVSLIQALFVLIGILVIFEYVTYTDIFDRLLYFIWFSMVVSAVIAVFSDTITPWTFRKTGGTGDPNEFATQLLATIAITIYLFTKNRNILFLMSSLGLFFYTLLYAGSKSSLLTLAALVLFMLVTKFSDLLKKIFSFKTILVIGILGVLLSIVDIGQMKAIKGIEQRAQSSGTAKTRFVSWNAGVRMAEDNFITGVGVEQYEKNVKRYATDFIAKGSYAPHNFLIKVLGEAGFFPFVTLLLFLFVLFVSEYRNIIESEYIWIYISALSVVLMGLTLSISYEKYFWLFLGLLSHVNYLLFLERKEGSIYEDHAYLA